VSGEERLAVLTEGLFDDHHAKTAHGVIRYGTREVVAVVDSSQAGRTASEVVPFCEKPVPIVATVAEAADRGATTMLIGIAPTGGRLDPSLRSLVLEAIDRGLNIEAGLHTILAEDPEFSAAAERHGVGLRDLRLPPPDLSVPRGPNDRAPGVSVVHSVGSDVAIGKKAVTVELDAAARARGLKSVYVPTGQTGIAIAGWGIAVDHVLSDYVAGAAERLVDEGAKRGELLFVEGQGSLFHPAYSAVTLGLLHGSSPDLLVLAHRADATHFEGYPELPLPSLPELIEAYEMACRPLRPVRVAAVALNTSRLNDDEARAAIERAQDETGLPADDLVRFGADRVLDAVLSAFEVPV
jgi:D-glutamate N-acetyltransferase